MTYEAALAELRSILQQMQDGKVPIEEMGEKIKRAVELVKFCKEKLRQAEEEVERLFGEMDL